MTEEAGEAAVSTQTFSFIKGKDDVLACNSGESFDWDKSAATVREQLADAMNARNISFLLGSGCSSFIKDGKQLGIPTMEPLAQEFTSSIGQGRDRYLLNATERKILKSALGLDLAASHYGKNLEKIMEVLHSHRVALRESILERHKRPLACIETAITKVQRYVLRKCTDGACSNADDTVRSLYETFYRKLIYRDRSLPRSWIFTTNYDLFNESAMDRIGLPYCNGFTGTVERRFNPAVFRYALAEQLDLTSKRWSAVDGYAYLCKLHGSITWIEDGQGLFPIREIPKPDPESAGSLMIYPTPSKQNASLSSPYVDLFREFQSHIVREQSVLIVLGYSFGDEHLNNIIYQALTVPTFRLIVFSTPTGAGELAKLRNLADPRIWIVGGEGPNPGSKAHYFDTFVEKFMPEPPGDRIDTAVHRILTDLIGRDSSGTTDPGTS